MMQPKDVLSDCIVCWTPIAKLNILDNALTLQHTIHYNDMSKCKFMKTLSITEMRLLSYYVEICPLYCDKIMCMINRNQYHAFDKKPRNLLINNKESWSAELTTFVKANKIIKRLKVRKHSIWDLFR